MSKPAGKGRDVAMDGTSAEMWGARSGPAAPAGRGAWLRDSRFAMFIHWGLYSELAGEWQGKRYHGIAEWIMHRARIPVAEYEQVAGRFNPTGFDAREWVRLAKAAGMRHLMITAKHHDGFAMFRSAVSPYNIVDATPFRRDPMKELAEACRAEGLRLGFYYSQTADWHEPDGIGNSWDSFPKERDFKRYLRTKAMPQIEELLTHYGPLAGIWFDTPGPITPEESKELVDLVHRLQPDCLVNSRIGNDLGDYDTLGDQEIPRLPRAGLWETPDTHNDTWAYARHDRNWKGPREVAERLVRVVSRGGTYMLNIGPDGSGRIPAQSARILREVGRWVTAHEEAIHGAGPTPLGPLAWGECTRRGNRLFLHVFQWPADGRLIVPGLRSAVSRAGLAGEDVPAQASADGVVLTLPRLAPEELIPVVTLELAGPAEASRDTYVLNGCRNTLDSGVAQRHGCDLRAARWMEKFGDWKHADSLSGWRAGESSATWEFRTVEPGSFLLDVEYTCPEAGDYSEWCLQVGDTEVLFPLLDSGERSRRAAFGWGELPRFRLYRVGQIDLPGPGVCRLDLRPLDAAGAAVRIAALTLTPLG